MNPPERLMPKPNPFPRRMLSRSIAWGRLALSQAVKHLLVLAVLTGGQAFAQNWRDADATFKVQPGVKRQREVKWVVVSNLQATCEAESYKRGLGGFNYALEACSFWDDRKCTIVTSTNTTMHQLGHELRHCFMGNFH